MGTTDAANNEATVAGKVWGYNYVRWDFAFQDMGQTTENGCWLAVLKMMFQCMKEAGKAFDPAKVESTLIANAFGKDEAAFRKATTDGLLQSQRAGVFKALNMQVFPNSDVGDWSANDIVKYLHANGPLMFTQAILNDDGSWKAHAMLIRTLDNTQDPYNSDAATVTLINPYDAVALKNSPPGPVFHAAEIAPMTVKKFGTLLPPDKSISAADSIAMLPA